MVQFVSRRTLRALLIGTRCACYRAGAARDTGTLSARSRGRNAPRDFAIVSRTASTLSTGLFVGVSDIALRLLCRGHLLRLNQRVHDPSAGRPTGVTVGTASPR